MRKMKRLLPDLGYLPKAFIIFLVLMMLVSVFGGYQLSRLIYKMIDFPLQRAEQLLVIEKNMDDAAIELGMQIQEWKDMLLRANDVELYRKHRKAFLDSSVDVQYALQRAKISMQNVGLDTGVIDQLSIEHKSLVSNYVLALNKLNPRLLESAHAVDKQVVGADRRLQQHLAEAKADIERLAQQHLNGSIPGQEKRYWLVGLLGAASLFVMALTGFIFAFRILDHEIGAVEHLPST